jgi:hypothetical protein
VHCGWSRPFCPRSSDISKPSSHRHLRPAALPRETIGINPEHIPGITNIMADFLSHPDISLTCSACLAQSFRQYSFLQTWPYFRRFACSYDFSPRRSSAHRGRSHPFCQ